MKRIKIDTPCNENWTKMLPSKNGKHCLVCNKDVIDFTKMSDQEILSILKNTKSSICGKTKSSQLNRNLSNKTINTSFYKTALVAMSVSFIPITALTQSQTDHIEIKVNSAQKKFIISGSIKDEDNDPAIAANVMITKNSTFVQACTTGLDGNFTIEFTGEKISDFQIKISYLGYQDKIITLSDNPSPIHFLQVKLPIDENNLQGDIIVVEQLNANIKTQIHSIISGTITIPNGEPLIYANIILEQDGEFIHAVATDLDGMYQFSDIPNGVYNLKVSFIGYADQFHESIIISEASNKESIVVNFTMQEGCIDLLGEIVYIPSRWERFKNRILFWRR